MCIFSGERLQKLVQFKVPDLAEFIATSASPWQNKVCRRLAVSIVAIVVAGGLSGCSSAGYHKGDSAARSLESGAGEVQAESRSLDSTLGCLDDLVNKPSADLKPQFRGFSAALDRLMTASKRAQAAIQDMEQRNAAYLAAWDKELEAMNYEAIRDHSEARRNEVAEHFNEVNRRFQDTQSVMGPLISYLQDIRTALSADLTASGLDAIKPNVENADQNAAKVKLALGQLADQLADSSAKLSSVATAASQTSRRE
ncbi:conserved hypothetical protein [Verrucomicrobia bacterium]|nr:conserved hypothetical protein [Verrucomicrobiota bacterium]